jgi:hypothetical protein
MHRSPKNFSEILAASSPYGTSPVLTNLTFFAGAGFSKSWDERFPVGNALFSFTQKEWSKHSNVLEEFLVSNNYRANIDLTATIFKDIVYQIGMMRKYPHIRPRYIDDQNLDVVERHLRYLVRKKFEATAPLYYEVGQKLRFDKPPTLEQQFILDFFGLIQKSGDGSDIVAQGLRANYVTTNYDYVIEGILDNCISDDDTYALYTYRGITPARYCGRSPYTTVHDNWLVSNLLKINGGFEVFSNNGNFEFDYTSNRTDAQLRVEPPQLMLASREQDYTQKYFHSLFPKVIRLLQETRILIIVGYSLPEEDALIRLIIKQFAEDRADGDQKVLFYVDRSTEAEQQDKINSVFPHVSEMRGLTLIPYSGSFANWCREVVEAYSKLGS